MRVRTFSVSLFAIAAICGGQAIDSKADPKLDKTQEIRLLLAASGVSQNVDATWDAMTPQLAVGLRPVFLQAIQKEKGEKAENVDAAINFFLGEFRKQLKDEDLVERLAVPMYEERFSADEIHQLRLFYETPLGRKIISTQPLATQKLVAGGQKLGKELAQHLMTDPTTKSSIEAILRGDSAK